MIAADNAAQAASDDLRFMREAIALGWRNQGLTSPNPSVGSVVVRMHDGVPVVIGTGVTQPGGRPHGEPMALAMAGEAARGATMYVTLEPCSHHGRAGPCSDAIIAAGIARVVSGIEDPDSRVCGQGFARMRAAGIAVESGVLANEVFRAHRGHIQRVTMGRPLVTVKLARTCDGYAGMRDGRLLITGQAANHRVHLLRAHADAVLTGIGTVLADDPLLTVRLPGMEARSPVRIVADSGLRMPVASRLVQTAKDVPVWVVAAPDAPAEREEELARAGVRVLRIETAGGRISLPALLALLASEGIARVFCEGGPLLAEALAMADCVDEAIILSGTQPLPPGVVGVPAIGPALSRALSDATRLRSVDAGFWGDDAWSIFERPF